MARITSVAENLRQLFSSSQTALTLRSLKNRIDFLLMTMANLTLFAQIFSLLPKENEEFAVAMADGGVVMELRDEIEFLQSSRREYLLRDFCGWRECVIFVCEEFKFTNDLMMQ